MGANAFATVGVSLSTMRAWPCFDPDFPSKTGVEPFFPSPHPTVNALPGKAESQPVAQSDRRKRQQIRAHSKDKNALRMSARFS
jgi:hypothetical protein